MKKWMFILFAFSFFMPVAALAQHSSKAAEAVPAAQMPRVSKKAVAISGRVSLDGKSLISEENDVWNVINPNVLAGHKGQQVSVKCQVQTDKSEIQVLSVKVAEQEVKSTANRGDSAFRR